MAATLFLRCSGGGGARMNMDEDRVAHSWRKHINAPSNMFQRDDIEGTEMFPGDTILEPSRYRSLAMGRL